LRAVLFFAVLFFAVLFFAVLLRAPAFRGAALRAVLFLRAVPFFAVLFFAVLFFAVLLRAVLFFAALFRAVLFRAVLFFAALFRAVALRAVPFFAVLLRAVLFRAVLLRAVALRAVPFFAVLLRAAAFLRGAAFFFEDDVRFFDELLEDPERELELRDVLRPELREPERDEDRVVAGMAGAASLSSEFDASPMAESPHVMLDEPTSDESSPASSAAPVPLQSSWVIDRPPASIARARFPTTLTF
jgi:hypothetical protein